VSQPQSQEPDPLLAFSSESPAAADPAVPAEPDAQPAISEDFPPSPSSPPVPPPSETGRLDRIERALDRSQTEIQQLTSEVATLVGSIADMNKRMSRLQTAPVQPRSSMSRTLQRTVSALAAVLVVLSAGVVSWRYWPDGAPTIPAPIEQVEAATPLAPGPVPAPPASAVDSPAPAAPQLVSEPPAPPAKRVSYVGALSIDSAPGGSVFVDRKMAGRTPLRVEDLRAGAHLIWIERDGYRRWTRVVTVTANRLSRVSAELEPMASR
jgi:hypothetical protein